MLVQSIGDFCMPKYGEIYTISPADEIILSVNDLKTFAIGVLIKMFEKPLYIIGWKGWTGYRDDNTDNVRWAKMFKNYDEAEEHYHQMIAQGAKIFRDRTIIANHKHFAEWKKQCFDPSFSSEKMTLKEIESFVAEVWADEEKINTNILGQKCPIIKDGRGRTRRPGGRFNYYNWEIALPKVARTKGMALLLLTYGLVPRNGFDAVFLNKMADLFERYLGCNASRIKREWLDFGIEI